MIHLKNSKIIKLGPCIAYGLKAREAEALCSEASINQLKFKDIYFLSQEKQEEQINSTLAIKEQGHVLCDRDLIHNPCRVVIFAIITGNWPELSNGYQARTLPTRKQRPRIINQYNSLYFVLF